MKTQYISVNGLDADAIISYYEDLKKKLSSLVYYLKKSENSLNEFDVDLSKYYSIEGSRVESVNISSIKDELNKKIIELEGTVIPAIDNQINTIKNISDNIGNN